MTRCFNSLTVATRDFFPNEETRSARESSCAAAAVIVDAGGEAHEPVVLAIRLRHGGKVNAFAVPSPK